MELQKCDLQLFQLLQREAVRQTSLLNMIASENFPSANVLQTLSSAFTNKYAEGVPKDRYYAGVENCDSLELMCQDRALRAFGVWGKDYFANVQPLSGSPANLAVYHALLKPGDRVLSLRLFHGSHLSHGAKHSITNSIYEFHHFPLNKEIQLIDYNIIEKHISDLRPSMLVVGFSAYPRDLDYKTLRFICDKYQVFLHVDFSHPAGLIQQSLLNDPFPYADTLMCTTHKTLRGPRGAIIFGRQQYEDQINKAVFPGIQGGPHMNNIAGITVALKECTTQQFSQYCTDTVRMAQVLSLNLKDNFVKLFTDGTDCHYVVAFCENSKQVAKMLENIGIIVNVQRILNREGIRIGVQMLVSQGINEDKDFQLLASIISCVIHRKPISEEQLQQLDSLKKRTKQSSMKQLNLWHL